MNPSGDTGRISDATGTNLGEDDADNPDLATRDGDVWTLPHAPAGTMTVTIRDNQQAKSSTGVLVSEVGNKTVRTFTP